MTELEASINIYVKTEYIEEQSYPNDERYLFRYTITIINLGKESVTLKTSYWSITDSNQHLSVVQGAGVVGETPKIEADTAYQYTSGVVLETPLGVMEGNYGMVTKSGEVFKVKISPFRLSTPGLLH